LLRSWEEQDTSQAAINLKPYQGLKRYDRFI